WTALVAATIWFVPKRRFWAAWQMELPAIPTERGWWFAPVLALLVLTGVVALLCDLSPEIFYDSLHYHLAVPNLYLLSHRIYNEPNFAYASFVMVVQMFWGFALTFGTEITVRLLHVAMPVLLFVAFMAFESR